MPYIGYHETANPTNVDGENYPVFEIRIDSSDFREYLDDPTPDKCRYLVEYVLDYMLDNDGIDDIVKGYALSSLDDYEVEQMTDRLCAQFNKEYRFLYENGDERVAGYDEALADGDRLIREENVWVRRLARRRCDIITSDRETAAFAFAMADLDLI